MLNNLGTANYGVYSPSNAEARRLDVPSMTIDPTSNRTYSTRQLIQPIHNNINNNNAAIAHLGIPTGGIKVLPTNTIKLINVKISLLHFKLHLKCLNNNHRISSVFFSSHFSFCSRY